MNFLFSLHNGKEVKNFAFFLLTGPFGIVKETSILEVIRAGFMISSYNLENFQIYLKFG